MQRVVNPYFVYKILSRSLLIVTFFLIGCAVVAYWFDEKLMPFVYSALLASIVVYIFYVFTNKATPSETLHRKDAYLSVTLSWLLTSAIGSLPYLFSGAIPSVVNAFFESMSGFTTTGSSILTDIESLPKSILFWRSLTHWIGGIGIIALVILIMPKLQIGGYHLFVLESSMQEKIRPRIRSVGKRLLVIYIFLTLAEVGLLFLGKMSLFESLCHAFGTIATGGFSPRNSSIADYSPYIQYTIMGFMILGGTNFIIHYYLFTNKLKKIADNEELRFFILAIIFIGITLTFVLLFKMNKPLEESFRESFFQVISIVTCTGYSTADYMLWPEFAWGIIFFSMFIGGCSGSTAGGIKVVRHLVATKNIFRIFRQLLNPNAIIPLKLNKKSISLDSNSSILTFMSVYLLLFMIGSLLMLLHGLDIKTSISSIATCMAGIGPGIGSIGPANNFAHLPATAKVILTVFMLVGRLEIYTVLVLFTRNFWRV